jgi:hypothetical protein
MYYRAYTPELELVNKIIVDGNDCGVGLELSHWPGNSTPPAFKADLSLESVLRFLTAPSREIYTATREIITNNHYDTDGLLATWCMLNPQEAWQHASTLCDTAAAGDFYEFTSPSAVQFDLIVRAFENESCSPVAGTLAGRSYAERCQIASEALMEQLPSLLYDTRRYKCLWEESYARILELMQTINKGHAAIHEWPEERMSTIVSPVQLDHYSRNMFSNGHRILEANPTDSGTMYCLHYREFLWYDVITRSSSPRHSLYRVAEKLNELEPTESEGTWAVSTKWSPPLLFIADSPRQVLTINHETLSLGHSALSVGTVERVILEGLRMLDDAYKKKFFQTDSADLLT